MITGMYDLTPVEDRGGRWYKRDDLTATAALWIVGGPL